MEINTQTRLYPDIPLLDAHVHVEAPGAYEGIRESMEASSSQRMNILAIPSRKGGNGNEILLPYKERDPERFCMFGALDYRNPDGEAFDPSAMTDAGRKALAERLGKQPARLKAQGFDGIKLIESNPTVRRWFPFPVDSEVYAPFFAAVDNMRLPLLWHVGDPEDFWDPEKIHAKARARGALYNRPGDPSLEAVRGEAENVLARHPNLIVIFAHFYFLGNKLERARRMFQTYPHVTFDTTPGTQMFKFFNDQREQTLRFFIEFQDRIMFGTDMCTGGSGKPPWNTQAAIHNWRMKRLYYGSDEVMPSGFIPEHFNPRGDTVRGLNLPKETMAKLFHENFERVVGR